MLLPISIWKPSKTIRKPANSLQPPGINAPRPSGHGPWVMAPARLLGSLTSLQASNAQLLAPVAPPPGFALGSPGTFASLKSNRLSEKYVYGGGGFLLFPTPAPYFLHSLPPTLGQHGLLTAVYLGRLRPHRERIACPPSPQSSYWAATTGPGVWLDSILAKQRNPHSLEELWLGSTGRIVRYKRTIKKKGITGHILSKMDSCATNDTIFNDFLTITQWHRLSNEQTWSDECLTLTASTLLTGGLFALHRAHSPMSPWHSRGQVGSQGQQAIFPSLAAHRVLTSTGSCCRSTSGAQNTGWHWTPLQAVKDQGA